MDALYAAASNRQVVHVEDSTTRALVPLHGWNDISEKSTCVRGGRYAPRGTTLIRSDARETSWWLERTTCIRRTQTGIITRREARIGKRRSET
jgi:hypothetical protein